MRDDRGHRGASHTHIQGKDKYGIKNNIGNGADQDGDHTHGGKSLTGDEVIHAHSHQSKESPGGIDGEISIRVGKGRLAGSEPPEKLIFHEEKTDREEDSQASQHAKTVRENLARFFLIAFSHFHG